MKNKEEEKRKKLGTRKRKNKEEEKGKKIPSEVEEKGKRKKICQKNMKSSTEWYSLEE